MKTRNDTIPLLAITAIVIALAFVAGATIAYPILEAHASNAISESKNRGQQGSLQSGGQSNGGCGRPCNV